MRNEVVSIDVPKIGTINVSARMKGECNGTQMFNLKHYKYTLRIWSEHGEMNVIFHDSFYNWSKRIKKLDRGELLNALDCILSDISIYLNDEIKWCYDDEDWKLMKRAEKGCINETEKFTVVVGGEENLWTAIEFLTEYINKEMNNN